MLQIEKKAYEQISQLNNLGIVNLRNKFRIN